MCWEWQINGLVQERRHSIAIAVVELRLSCTNPSRQSCKIWMLNTKSQWNRPRLATRHIHIAWQTIKGRDCTWHRTRLAYQNAAHWHDKNNYFCLTSTRWYTVISKVQNSWNGKSHDYIMEVLHVFFIMSLVSIIMRPSVGAGDSPELFLYPGRGDSSVWQDHDRWRHGWHVIWNDCGRRGVSELTVVWYVDDVRVTAIGMMWWQGWGGRGRGGRPRGLLLHVDRVLIGCTHVWSVLIGWHW